MPRIEWIWPRTFFEMTIKPKLGGRAEYESPGGTKLQASWTDRMTVKEHPSQMDHGRIRSATVKERFLGIPTGRAKSVGTVMTEASLPEIPSRTWE